MFYLIMCALFISCGRNNLPIQHRVWCHQYHSILWCCALPIVEYHNQQWAFFWIVFDKLEILNDKKKERKKGILQTIPVFALFVGPIVEPQRESFLTTNFCIGIEDSFAIFKRVDDERSEVAYLCLQLILMTGPQWILILWFFSCFSE